MELLHLALRWVHVVFGVLWVGIAWFFNFIISRFVMGLDAEARRAVVPKLLPRPLFLFRNAAGITWLTGFFLLGLVYYSGGALAAPGQSTGLAIGLGVASLFVSFLFYEVLWTVLSRKPALASVLSLVLLTGVTFGLSRVMSGRALFIHVGAIFGTIMIGNVGKTIMPNQRKIINALRQGTAPAEGLVYVTELRARHNTYLSVPLMFFMVSNHFPTVYGSRLAWALAPVFVILGWAFTKGLYSLSGRLPDEMPLDSKS